MLLKSSRLDGRILQASSLQGASARHHLPSRALSLVAGPPAGVEPIPLGWPRQRRAAWASSGNGSNSATTTATTVRSPSVSQAEEEEQALRTELQEAQQSIEDLRAQVLVLDELQEHTQHQDKLMAQLKECVEQDRQRLEGEKAGLEDRVSALQSDLAASVAELAAAAPAVAELQRSVNELTLRVAEQDAEVVAAQKVAAEAIERARLLADRGGAVEEQAAAASGRGAGGRGFGRGSKKAGPAQADVASRQALQKAQEELEAARTALAGRVSDLAAVSRVRDELSAKVQQQERQLKELRDQVAEVQAAAGAALSEREEVLAQQLGDAQAALEAALVGRRDVEAHTAQAASVIESLTEQVTSLVAQCQAAGEEHEHLVSERNRMANMVSELDDMRRQQGDDIAALAASLEALHGEVEVAQQLKADLSLLADAFGAKEHDLEEAHAALAAARQREGRLTEELGEARQALQALQEAIRSSESINTELVRRVDALEVTFRTQASNAKVAGARIADTEQRLARASDDITALKAELAQKAQALKEYGVQLRDMTAARDSHATAVQRLAAQLSHQEGVSLQRGHSADLAHARVQELEKQVLVIAELEGAVRAGRASLAGREAQVQRLDQDLAAARTALAQARTVAEASTGAAAAADERAQAAAAEAASLRLALEAGATQLEDTENAAMELSQEVLLLQEEAVTSEALLATLAFARDEALLRAAGSVAPGTALAAAVRQVEHLQQQLEAARADQVAAQDLARPGALTERGSRHDEEGEAAAANGAGGSAGGGGGARADVALAAALAEVQRLQQQLDEQTALASRSLSGSLASVDAREAEALEAARLRAEVEAEARASMELLAAAEALLREVSSSEAGSRSPATAAAAAGQAGHSGDDICFAAPSGPSAVERAAALEQRVAELMAELQQAHVQVEASPSAGQQVAVTSVAAATPAAADARVASVALTAARTDAMSARAETEALRQRVSTLEAALQSQERQTTELLALQQQPKDKQLAALSSKVSELTVAKSKLERAAEQQRQALRQTRGFLMAKVSAAAAVTQQAAGALGAGQAAGSAKLTGGGGNGLAVVAPATAGLNGAAPKGSKRRSAKAV